MCNAISPPATGKNIFGWGLNKPIYIPCFSYDSYSNASGWSQYSNSFVINGQVDTTFYAYTKCSGVPYTDANFTTPIYGAGTYYTTLANRTNCDSVICLILSEYATVPTVPIVAAICEGKSYSDANFTNITQEGTYYDTLQNINHCDSIICLTVSVFPVPPVTQISDSLHQGDTCNFNGKLLTDAGTYYDTLQTIHGCDSIVELTLTTSNVGITNYELPLTNYVIYPNPTDGKITINNGQLTINNIEIVDILGQTLLSLPSSSSPETIIDISHLSNGIYFLRINNNKIIKLIKH